MQGSVAPAFLKMEGEVGHRERDAEMDRLLRAGLGGASPAAEPCPSAEDLAAYIEQAVPAGGREAFERHLAGCDRCQETVALLVTMPAAPPAVAGSPVAAWWRSGWKRYLVPATAIASAVVLYVALKPDTPVLDEARSTAAVTMAPSPSELPPPAVGPLPEGQALMPSTKVEEARGHAAKGGQAEPRSGQLARQVGALPGRPGAGANTRAEANAAPLADAAVPPAQVPLAGLAERPKATAPPPTAAPIAPPPSQTVAAAPGQRAAAAPPPVPALPAREEQLKVDPKTALTGQALPKVAEQVIVTGNTPTIESRQAASFARGVMFQATGTSRRWRLDAGGRISRSTDEGVSWQVQHTVPSAELLAGSAPSATVCWVVGQHGTVLLSKDGERWEGRPFPETVDLVSVAAADALHATVTARDGRRFSTNDGGASWARLR